VNKKDEALKMAIEQLNIYKDSQEICAFNLGFEERWSVDSISKAINACKKALEQPAQEPFIGGDCICPKCKNKSLYKTDKSEWCVTHKCLWQSDYPHQWQGLTDDEKLASIRKWSENNTMRGIELIGLCDAIEQALKEKNHD
jgi:hypothetical protein